MKNFYLTFCIIFFSCSKSNVLPNNFVKVNDAREIFQFYLSNGYSLADFPIIHTPPDWAASQMYVSDSKSALIVPYTNAKVKITYRPDSSIALGVPAIAFYYSEEHYLRMQPFLLIQRNDKHAAAIVAYTDQNTLPKLLQNDFNEKSSLGDDIVCTQTDWYTRINASNISSNYAYNYTTLKCLTVLSNKAGDSGIPIGGIFSGVLNMAWLHPAVFKQLIDFTGYTKYFAGEIFPTFSDQKACFASIRNSRSLFKKPDSVI